MTSRIRLADARFVSSSREVRRRDVREVPAVRAAASAFLACFLVAGLAPAAHATAPRHAPAALPAGVQVAACSWDRPGVDPFMGDVVAAVDRYTDIPADARARLKDRMARRDYDDIAVIRRDSVEGGQRYDAELRDMHFGTGRVCATVSRAAWRDDQQERGLVYCEGAQCLIVPTVCRNVSRVTRREAVPATSTAGAAPAGELEFAPPAAGVPAADPAPSGTGATPSSSTAASFADGAGGGLTSGPLGGGDAGGPPPPSTGFTPIPGGWVPVPGRVPSIPTPTSPVPEAPASVLMMVGLAGLAWLGRQRVQRLASAGRVS